MGRHFQAREGIGKSIPGGGNSRSKGWVAELVTPVGRIPVGAEFLSSHWKHVACSGNSR